MAKSNRSFLQVMAGFNPALGWKYLVGLVDNFGWPFFLLMTSVYFGIKGALHLFLQQYELPYYREAGLDGSVYQTNNAISFIPWTLKAGLGALSDLFPLFGYKKTAYLWIYALLGSLGCLALIFIPLETTYQYPVIGMFMFFFMYLETGGFDLLVQGKYVEQMKKRPNTKANIVTYSWFGTILGGLFPSATVGIFTESLGVKSILYIILPLCLHPLIFLIIGGMVEDKVPKDKANKFDIEKWKRELGPMLIAMLIVILAIGTILTTLFGNNLIQLIYSIVAATIIIFAAFKLIMNVIARALTYKFLAQFLYVNITGALDYYYMGEPSCVPDGPNFDYLFYRTYVTLAGQAAQVIGLTIFQVVMISWKFRPVFWSTTLLRVIGSCFDLIMVNRLNKKLGIPDKAMFIMGNAIIYQTTYMLDIIPGVILNAKMCPKDLEATMMSIMAGITNYGGSLSKLVGVYLIDIFGIVTEDNPDKGITCNFDNITWLIITAHFILPLLCIPLSFLLIPNRYMFENFVDTPESLGYYDYNFKIFLSKKAKHTNSSINNNDKKTELETPKITAEQIV